MSIGGAFFLKRKHKDTTVEIAQLNREMALRMIVLAGETGDVDPLIDAVKAMRATEELYNQDSAPIENAQIQKKLGDILLKVGRNEHNKRALEASISAYRGAITIASLLGAESLRREARQSYANALNYRDGHMKKPSLSLMGAA